MKRLRGTFRPGTTLRSRLRLVIGMLLGLAAVNVGASAWGARERRTAFDQLQQEIEHHTALTELRAATEDEYKRIKVASELGVDAAPLSVSESARIGKTLAAMSRQFKVMAVDPAPRNSLLVRLAGSAEVMLASWRSYYAVSAIDPAKARAEFRLGSEPLARQLLRFDLPEAIRLERDRVRFAADKVARADQLWFWLVSGLLIVTGIVSSVLAYTLSRDFGRALSTLKQGVEWFGAGTLTHRVRVIECDELQEVASSLNGMAANLLEARNELQERNSELTQLAFRDPLTNLSNRALFRDRLVAAFSTEGRPPQEIAILFIDLDNFKTINDTYGHEAGDRLLIDVAARLLNATRGSDTVARLGGDEFAVLLNKVRSPEEAIVVGRRVLASMQAPYVHQGIKMTPSASIGIACGQPGGGAPELMRNADVAMYRAKARGRGLLELFATEMHTALVDRAELEGDLRGAGTRGELLLEYQPIVDLRTRRIMGLEALIRWHHPRRGVIRPLDFIPMAEENGDIVEIGKWVLEHACADAADWPATGSDERPSVTINVSALQLEDEGFVAHLEQVLARTGISPGRVILEITETVVLRDDVTARHRLWDVKRLGVQLAIDDFGTGYSSLASLQRFPVDILKIDKTFVDKVADGEQESALARTIVALGDSLSLRLVAEGIEHEAQRDALLAMGCQLGQGYLFARPIPAASVRTSIVAAAVREISGIRLVTNRSA